MPENRLDRLPKEGKTEMFSEWVRRAGFWALDFLKGSEVRRHYDDIQTIMENGAEAEVSKTQGNYLNSILKYATENVEFYKKIKGFEALDSFPVINKNVIKENYPAFQSPEFLDTAVVNMHTSGSTGTPLVVRQDKNKRNRVYAEMMYFWGKAGYQVGMKYAYFRIWTSLNQRSKLSAWARNILMCDIVKLDDENLAKIRQMLKADRKIKMLLGYASTFENLANYLLACRDTPGMFTIETIICFAESLPESTHRKLKEVFNCQVVSLYSNQENGMLAQECVENKEFHVNKASYYIELLKMDVDEPVGVGEPGRIVVTDLFNRAMPLIRYDTGDVGIWKNSAECGWHSQVFASIQGRMVDFIFTTEGVRISPEALCNYMWPFDKLLQYQFVQEGPKQYVLKLNGAKGYYEDVTFVNLFKGFLGQDAEITIEHVKEIPVLSSGKRKNVVNNYGNGKAAKRKYLVKIGG